MTEETKEKIKNLDNELYMLHLEFKESVDRAAEVGIYPNVEAIDIKEKCLAKLTQLVEDAQRETKKDYIYNLRFFRTEEGTLCMEEASEEGFLSDADMYLFGLYIAESELLDNKDKEAMASFCKAYLSKIN